jgi:hypothetical protein
MYPHERSLVKRLEGKPFVLLGINSDPDREQLKKVLVEEQITWRSWWDEGNVEGPIHTQWQVTARPMIYILDADGIIRAKDVTGKSIDETVDKLVAELESKVKK